MAVSPADTPEIGLLTRRYVADRHDRSEIRKRTATSYREILSLMARALGPDRPAHRVSRRDIERWLAHSNVAASTKRRHLSVARGFFAWAVERGYTAKDPTYGIRPPKPERHVPRALTRKTADAVASQPADARLALAVSLMLQEGLRVGEVASLQLADVDLVDGCFRVTGKGGHERVLPLTVDTRRLLDAYLETVPHTAGPLLRSYTDPHAGIGGKHLSRLVARHMRRAGAADTAHSLRHTAATDMLRSGAKLTEVQQALGHQSLQSTQMYLGLAALPDLRRAMGGRRYGRRVSPNGNGRHPDGAQLRLPDC